MCGTKLNQFQAGRTAEMQDSVLPRPLRPIGTFTLMVLMIGAAALILIFLSYFIMHIFDGMHDSL